MKLQILDADYKMPNHTPVLRLFCKDEKGNSRCVFVEDFDPYFYVKAQDKERLANILEDKYSGEIKKLEEVQRRIPIGYRKGKEDFIKVTNKNPRKVPEIRDFLQKKDFVDGVYEADILFKYRYLADIDSSGMGWIEAECKNAQTNTVKIPAMKAKDIESIEKVENAPLRYLSFDIECIAEEDDRMVDAEKDPIVLISCSFDPAFKGEEDIVLVAKPGSSSGKHFRDEEEMLEKFVEIIDQYDPDIITGYNLKEFDIPYVFKRLEKYGIPKTVGRCEKPARCNKYGNNTDVTIRGRVVVDPYQIIKRDPYMRLMRYDLDTVSQELLGENKEDVAYDEMKELWESGGEDLQRFVTYCEKDARLALDLLTEKGILDKFFELAKISGLLLQDTMGGQTQRISNRLLREFKKRDYLLPVKPSDKELERRNKKRRTEALKGGLVLEPIKGLHTDACVSVLDFKSLYPSVMSTYNICPTTLVEDEDEVSEDMDFWESPSGEKFVKSDVRKGILPKIVEELIDTRTEVKKEMKEAKDPEMKSQLNAKQLALKTMTNSFYGYTGYYRTRLYRLAIANAITSLGRYVTETTKKMCEEDFGVTVAYGDTDSVMVKGDSKNLDEVHELSSEISEYITNELPGRLILEPEKIYRSFLILTKKRYAGWAFIKTDDGWKEKIDMKGIETVRRDWCRLVSETMEEVIDIILKEGNINKAITFVQEIIDKLSNREVPLKKLEIVKSLTKKVENYDGTLPHIELAKKMKKRDPSTAPTPGDRLPFVIIEGNQIISKRVEHPDYIKENDLKVDADYYIHSQLLPPIKRIFEVIGVDEDELLGNGRQTSLGEVLNGEKVDRDRDVAVSKSPEETVIKNLENFTCKNCGKEFRRVPLRGKCDCGGSIYASSAGSIGKMVQVS
ncbi:MAG: DNA polymerase domain-containing protein [Candidatus Aenigmatarchaeota archaeon]